MKRTGPEPPDDRLQGAGFQRVKATYTVREIAQLFGLSPRSIRRWSRQGIVQGEPGPEGELLYDFRALTVLRRIRELRASGLAAAQVESQLSGQLNLFGAGQGKVLALRRRLSNFEEGLRFHEKGDSRAARCYRDSIKQGEYVADSYCNLGILEFEAGRIAKAADCFTLSLKADPRHFESHFNLGNLYYDAGDYRLARLHYEITREIEPLFPHLYFNLGLVNIKDGDLEHAIDCLVRCRELLPEGERGQVEELLTRLYGIDS